MRDALMDDLNTPLALSGMHAMLGDLNKAEDAAEKAQLKGALLDGGALLGLLQDDPEAWLRQGAGADGLSDADIDAMLAARNDARKSKDFAEADRIRDDLAEQGVILEDKPEGTIWRRA